MVAPKTDRDFSPLRNTLKEISTKPKPNHGRIQIAIKYKPKRELLEKFAPNKKAQYCQKILQLLIVAAHRVTKKQAEELFAYLLNMRQYMFLVVYLLKV